MKKLIIIGAGVAGLAAGIYGRINGFDTEIYEMHSIPGGECTGWKRKDYYFDGCIHWLMGSKDGNSLNKVWREVGALDDTIRIINHEYFYSYEKGGKCVYLYSDIEKLRTHLMEVAPEDQELITLLCKEIKALKCIQMPTKKPYDLMKGLDLAKMVIEMLPAMKYLPKLEKITIGEFANQFKSPILRSALMMLIPPHFKATALVSTIASMAAGDSGWPEGGSLAFAKRMEERYKSLGGKVFYKSRIREIIIEQGISKGIVLEDGTKCLSDYVISTADGHHTLYDMLGGKYLNDDLKALYSDSEAYPVYTTVQVSLGVNSNLAKYPHTRFVEMASEVDGGGKTNKHLGFRHFCFDKTLMPEGKTALITVLHADFNWWKEKYSDIEAYNHEKRRIAQEIKAVAEDYYPELKDSVEIIDVATPMTYVRYCNAWEGAWMAWAGTPKGTIRYVPGHLPGLKNFYLAGQWTLPPGGLPSAVVTGCWVIQRICGIEKMKFAASAES